MRSRARSDESIRFAREQRSFSNDLVNQVWELLRNRRCRGQKFRREYPVPPFTADFCCVNLKLIIEVDGSHHESVEVQQHDAMRDRILRQRGYDVLRIR